MASQPPTGLKSQRDAFWDRIYDLARADRDIIVISADMGAPALDKFRRDLPAQFVNVGIAEQNAIAVGSGLAAAGKKVLAYAIAPFITLRCYEQLRVQCGIMRLPLTIVGVGAGFGYPDSGPTHHLLEDLTVLRVLPNTVIHSISDAVMAAAVADTVVASPRLDYVRLDRQVFPPLYRPGQSFAAGMIAHGATAAPAPAAGAKRALTARRSAGKTPPPGRPAAPGRAAGQRAAHPDAILATTGAMVHVALEVAARLGRDGIRLGVIDVHRLPVEPAAFLALVGATPHLFTLEEHFLPGGFGSHLGEILLDAGHPARLHRFGLDPARGYSYAYGGREEIRKFYGIDGPSLERSLRRTLAG